MGFANGPASGGSGVRDPLDDPQSGFAVDSDALFRRTRRRSGTLAGLLIGTILTIFFGSVGWLKETDGDIPLLLGVPLPNLVFPALAAAWAIAHVPSWIARLRMRRFASPRDLPMFIAGATTFARRYMVVEAPAICLLDAERTIIARWERDRVAVVVLEDAWGMTGVVIITDDDRCYEFTVSGPVGDHVLASLALGDRLGTTGTRKALTGALHRAGYPTTVSMGARAGEER